jgi:hypothetical protein
MMFIVEMTRRVISTAVRRGAAIVIVQRGSAMVVIDAASLSSWATMGNDVHRRDDPAGHLYIGVALLSSSWATM